MASTVSSVVMMKECIIICFAFSCATLTVSIMYISTAKSGIRSLINLEPAILKSEEKDLVKHLEDEYEKQRTAAVATVDVSNLTRNSEVGGQPQEEQDRNEKHVDVKNKNKTNEHSTTLNTTRRKTVLKNPKRTKPTHKETSVPVLTEKLRGTPDPLYTHHGYVGVLDKKKKLNLHCKQCSLVSSSGQILKSRMGYLIDEADCVFRMNDAPVPTFEEDVGTRTTVRVVGHIASGQLRGKRQNLIGNSPTKYIVGWGPLKALRAGGKGYAYNNLKELAKLYKNVQFYHVTEEHMKKADEIFEAETGVARATSGTYLSTGWFAMLLARDSCDEIHVYGMVKDNYCLSPTNNNVPYHYYQPKGRKECSYYRANERGAKHSHRFMTEKNVFAQWALEQPPIFFHHPSWNP